ncbi:MAG TPA: glutaredoxin domain-containing protein [Candidatus Paceibacterota bacterium]
MATITLFTKEGCPWCDGAREYLKKTGLPFEEKEVLASPENMKEMIEKSSQTKAPTIEVDGQILADTDAEAIEKFLKEKELIPA